MDWCKKTEENSDKFLEYIIAYIIPFLGFNLSTIPDLVSVVIVLILIGTLYVRSDLIYMNPMLNLFGYILNKVETDSVDFMVRSNNKLKNNQKLKVYLVSINMGVAK